MVAREQVAGTRNSRTRNALVVAEIALALVLLVGAGLLIQSFRRLQDVDPGFDPRNVLTMRLFLPESKYAESGRSRESSLNNYYSAWRRCRACKPWAQRRNCQCVAVAIPISRSKTVHSRDPNQQVTALNPAISHDYLRAMGIPLIKGRTFTEQETKETPRVVIINEAFARTHFSDENPLGKRLIIDDGQPLLCEIIGVARDIKQFSLASESSPTMYMPSD